MIGLQIYTLAATPIPMDVRSLPPISVPNVDEVARLVAIFGVVIALGSLVVAIAAYLRDRVALHVSFSRRMHLVGTEEIHDQMKWVLDNIPEIMDVEDELLERLEQDRVKLDPSKLWTYITIVNTGRRPVKFSKAGFVIRNESPLLALESEVKLLPEGESTDIRVDEDMLAKYEQENGSPVYAAFAIDIAAREYFSRLPFDIALKRVFGLSPLRSRRRASPHDR